MDIKSEAYSKIKAILEQDFILESPKDSKLAHFATPIAFKMAKELNQNPISIANDLALKLNEALTNDIMFESITSIKGYVNFKLSRTYLDLKTKEALKDPQNFAKGEKKNKSFLLEFVSANPTGPLHVGHARGAIFGDSLARVARHLGYSFDTEYYVNDAGNQIVLLGLSILLAVKKNILKEEVIYPAEYYKGDYINDLANMAYDHFEASFFVDSNISILATWAKDKILDNIKATLNIAGINIDNFVNESNYYDDLDLTIKDLKAHNATYEKDGKLWLKSSLKGDEKDRVIRRDDGRATYLAGDIVYHRDKLNRKYDKCINIWGADHHGYIARIKASIEYLGFDSSNLEVILAQMVSLLKDGKEYKMSKRAGNFILMQDVLEEIGTDALRLIFLSKKCDTHLEFDINDLLKQDSSNPVFYINYAHARVHQVFAKASKNITNIIDADFNKLNSEGLDLAFKSLNLYNVLNDAFENRALQKIVDYLKDLASIFHSFYNENKVINSDNEDSLLKLFALVALSINTALGLLGIKAKNKMQH